MAILAALALASTPAHAADISSVLIAKAKQEGEVVYYTDLIVDQIVRPLASAFEAKYGIKVSYARADSQVNILKLTNEQKAGRVMSDIFGLNTGLEVLIAAGAARPFTTANGEELPARYRDPDHYWVSSHLFVITPAFNTDLVPPDRRPHSYDDLLAPFWRDKMVWKPNDLTGAPGFIGNVLISMGEARGMDYLRKLSRQNIKPVNASARAVLDQVIAGEYAMSLQILNHHAAISARKGAPVDWVRMSPVTVSPGLVGMTAGSPHPNAGALFVEFMTSKEGQQIFQGADYLPARPDVPPRIPDLIPETGGFTGNVITPAITAKGYEHWNEVYKDLFQ
ncbi:MAG TPA: extracellular solute-binding protein [Xanthobacteraceae bacterium]